MASRVCEICHIRSETVSGQDSYPYVSSCYWSGNGILHAGSSHQVSKHSDQKLMHYTLCLKKNDTDVAGYIFNAHQPILVVFGRDVGESICY